MEAGMKKLSVDDGIIGRVNGKSTIFELTVKPGSTVYRYDVEVIKKSSDPKKADKPLTKENDAGIRLVQRECCQDILEALYGISNQFGSQCKYVYDGKRTLYTTKPIKLNRQTNVLKHNQLKPSASDFIRKNDVEVTITPNEQCPKLDYSDLGSALVSDVTQQADRSVRTFLEILTSQYLVNSGKAQSAGIGVIYDKRTTSLGECFEMRVGLKKGVRVNNESGIAKALVVADMKRGAFFSTESLADIYKRFVRSPQDKGGLFKFNRVMKDVRLVLTYDTSRTILFGYLSRDPINDRRMFVNGQSVPDFMTKKYGVRIQNPNWPGVHPAGPQAKKVIYPMEVLYPLAGQLVPTEKMSDQMIRKLLLENSVVPKERYNYVLQQMNEIATGAGAAFLQDFGVKIDMVSNGINIKQRRLPKILVKDKGQGKLITVQPNGSWLKEAMAAQFYYPTTLLKKWIVAYDPRIDGNQMKGYIANLIKTAKSSGMNAIPEPFAFRPVDINGLQALFIWAKENGIQFIFHMDDKRNPSHAPLKMFESYYEILTQQVLSENMGAGPQTIKNVIMKTNVKCFGLNSIPTADPMIAELDLASEDVLVIGYDVAHPSKPKPKDLFDLKSVEKLQGLYNAHPSVVGICANRMKVPQAFAGDFFYQECNRESVSPILLRTAVAKIVETVCKFGRCPKKIIIVRDGISEGQHQMAVLEELPAIRDGYNDAISKNEKTVNVQPKFVFVTATKLHYKRFYRENRGDLANTVPGDVIDEKVTRTDVPEFYLQSHNPLKGVPKLPQYATLVNELDVTQGQLQAFMIYLSNMHQVAALPTSLPLPIYLADELAKRGQDVYHAYLNYVNSNVATNPLRDLIPRTRIGQTNNYVYDFDALTKCFGYSEKKLYATRFNA